MISLLLRLEADPPRARPELIRHVEEITEWWEREIAWQREYPILHSPLAWKRRLLQPMVETTPQPQDTTPLSAG